MSIIWCELSNGFRQAQQLLESDRDRISHACFQVALQILRAFAQQDNFPIYGGVFASFTGKSFRETIAYLDRPLKTIEKKQEKARILTILGYSQQWSGNCDRARILHEEALNLARQASDQNCEVANLNHLSRLKLSVGEFAEAIDYGQRALLFSRQIGDPLGETNAIAEEPTPMETGTCGVVREVNAIRQKAEQCFNTIGMRDREPPTYLSGILCRLVYDMPSDRANPTPEIPSNIP